MFKLYKYLISTRFTVLIFSMLLPAVIFSPFLLADKPESFTQFDLLGAYYPQFVHGYYLFKSHIFMGIDFSTNNGASVYFLRPNFPVYYPIYQLSYILLNTHIKYLAHAFILIMAFQSFLSMYFCVLVGRKFFKLYLGAALVFANLYTCAILVTFGETPFYFIATLFPMAVYAALQAVIEVRLWRLPLFSVVYILILLAGYLPLSVHALGLAVLFSILYFYYINPGIKLIVFVLRLAIPVILPLMIVLPFYMAMSKYHILVTAIPHTQWIAAVMLSAKMQSFLTMISSAFIFYVPEGIALTIGLLPFVLLLICIKYRKTLKLNVSEKKVLLITTLIVIIHALLIFGSITGLPSIFYLLVPVLGGMHIYSRFLYVATFFFFLVFAILINKLILNKEQLKVSNWVIFFSILGVSLLILQEYINKLFPFVDIDTFVFEIMALLCTLFAFSCLRSKAIYFILIIFPFLLSVANFNVKNEFTFEKRTYEDSLILSHERSAALNSYLKSHTSKVFIKYVDLTSSIVRPTGLIQNYPWLIPPGSPYISNYMGYELHLGVDKDYPFPYFGVINIQYLINTGADYVIYNDSYTVSSSPLNSLRISDFSKEADILMHDNHLYCINKLNQKILALGKDFGNDHDTEKGIHSSKDKNIEEAISGQKIIIPNLNLCKKLAWTYKFHDALRLVDSSVPVLDLGFGYKVAKLKQFAKLLVAGETEVFNNGIIRVDSKVANTQIVDFKTNYSSFVSFKIINPSPSTIQYLLFPNKYLHLKINGKELPTTFTNSLITFQLDPGTYNIEFVYKNILQLVFLILYISFLSIVFFIVLWRFLVYLIKYAKKINN